MDILLIYQIVISISIFNSLVNNMELITTTPKLFGSSGILSWKVIQLHAPWSENNSFGSFLTRVYSSKKSMQLILILRFAKLITLLFLPIGSISFSVVLALLLINYMAVKYVSYFGNDGADQMNFLILVTVFLSTVPFGDSIILEIGIWFIALQSCLSYLVAGVSKAISSEWRGGTAVYDIFNSKTYGHAFVEKYLRDRKFLKVSLCWIVIIFESLFPLALFLPLEFALVFLIWGFLFHLMNALIMGLNSFFWAFLATYPAIIYINQLITQ